MALKPRAKSGPISKLVKGAAAAGIVGGAGYLALGGEDEPEATDAPAPQVAAGAGGAGAGPATKESASTSRTTQTTRKEGAAPRVSAPDLPAAQAAPKATLEDLPAYQAEYRDATRSPEEKALFKAQKDRLDAEIDSVRAEYAELRKQAKAEGDKEALRNRYAAMAEGLANAALTIAAAQQGLREGRAYAGSLQLSRNDWAAEIDRALTRAQKERALLSEEEASQAKDLDSRRADVVRRDELADARELTLTRDAKAAERGARNDVRGANLRREEAAVAAANARAGEQARLDLSAATANAGNAAAFAPTTTVQDSTRAGTDSSDGLVSSGRGRAAEQRVKDFADLSGAVSALQAKPSDTKARSNVVEFATKLGIPKAEVDQLLAESTGDGLLNMAEPKKVDSILKKYNPNLSMSGADASAAGARPVTPAAPPSGVQGPDGTTRTPPPGVRVRDTQTGQVRVLPPAQATEVLKDPRFQRAD